MEDSKNSQVHRDRRVHMANERTFLAWVRTGVGIMAFGFVLERFGILTRQLQLFSARGAAGDVPPLLHSYSLTGIAGICLIVAGATLVGLSYFRFKRLERQIDEGKFQPSGALDSALAVIIISIGLFLALYLFEAVRLMR